MDIRSDVAGGNSLRSSDVGKNTVVFGPTVFELPLLPYERQLIETIGVTEEEYRRFAAEAKRRGAVRPAEYADIPDIKAILPAAGAAAAAYLAPAAGAAAGKSATAVILTNVAISLVLTGVAYLLTPKPKQPEASKRTQLDLGSVNAANRFTPSRGFDTLTELADYGAPIPIIFGLYDKTKKIGGMLITPRLVWSRMLSHGTQQSAKLMFVIGEQGYADAVSPDGIIEPDLEGIFLGNNALDALYEDFFAFYWKRNSNILGSSTNPLVRTASDFNRIRLKNRFYGTAGEPSSGDPGKYSGPDDDVFLCPDNVSNRSTSFCHAFSPANSTQFGVYSAIPNGNSYRVNYEVVSITEDITGAQAHALTIRRIKIVGDQDKNYSVLSETNLKKVRGSNQEGTGRQYSPRMGITLLTKKSGGIERASGSNLTKIVRVQGGDIAEFEIKPTSIDEDKYQRSNNRGGENVGDINSTVAAEQIAADEAMQIGEQFAIGNTKWVVTARTLDRFDPDVPDVQKISLKCIDTDESLGQSIGIVSDANVVNPQKGYIGDNGEVGAAFFPITKVATGLFRNNKPAVVTEFGIRSKVFQQLNGLCAFNTVPTPAELEDLDKNKATVRNGTYTGSIIRASVFQVFVRQAGLDASGQAFSFRPIDLFFVVRGSKPVNQYNFIRFTHPGPQPIELEYKFVGIPASELRAMADTQEFIQLSASISNAQQPLVQRNVNVATLGTFEIEAAGFPVFKKDIKLNKEFLRKPRASSARKTTTIPSAIKRQEVLQQVQSGSYVRAVSMNFAFVIGSSGTTGRVPAFFHEIFGDINQYPLNSQQTKETLEVFNNNKWVKVKWTVSIASQPDPNHYSQLSKRYEAAGADIVGSSAGFSSGEVLQFRRGSGATSGPNTAYSSNNPFAAKRNPPLTYSGLAYRVVNTRSQTYPEGRAGAYYYEIFGSPENLSVGDKKTENRILTLGAKSISMDITGTVVSLPTGHFTGLTKKWDIVDPITVVNDSNTTSSWNKGDTFDDTVSISVSPTTSNPFYWDSSITNVGFKYLINDLTTVPRQVSLSGETQFEGQSQYADLSFYRDLVQKSNQSEPEHSLVYVNEILPNQTAPQYDGMTLAGLSLKASRNFTSLDQMRCWLGSGLNVKRLHPNYASAQDNPYGDSSSPFFQQQYGPSNLFTDLVFYLLTNRAGGAGTLLGMTAADPFLLNVTPRPGHTENDFEETARFLSKQELFFNGVIAERTNLRQFITDIAPYFLCNFAIMDGKFSLLPAIPYNPASGEINTGSVVIDQLFTAGNILEDSYKVEYLRSEERRNFTAVLRYRHEAKNKLPEERVIEVNLNGTTTAPVDKVLPKEQFDLTQFCTSKEHAIKVGQYFLAIRKLVTHTISFSTTVEGLNLRAGSYIRVITEASPYSSAKNGTVDATGAVISFELLPNGTYAPLGDGTYTVIYFQAGSTDVQQGQMQISNGQVSDTTFHDSVFTVQSSSVSQNIYVVEQLTFSQEGTVDIVASEHPCGSSDKSELARLITTPSAFTVIG